MGTVRWQNRDSISRTEINDVALDCLRAGMDAAHPANQVAKLVTVDNGTLHLSSVDGSIGEYDLETYDEIHLLGGGNAAGHFASELEKALGSFLDNGMVITDDPVETRQVSIVAGDHPVPSETGAENTTMLLERAEAATEDDLVIVPITGGGSALLAAPTGDLTLDSLQSVTAELLACGASIDEINAVRKHCSAIKGGQLAQAAAPASVVTLIISDVIHDDRSVIASGPTVPDSSTYEDALAVLDRYDLDVPSEITDHLEAGVNGNHPETPAATDPAFDRTHSFVIGNGRTALEAAASVAVDHSYTPVILSSSVRGEARHSALTHVAIAEECRTHESPWSPPVVLLSGGETTVTLGEEYGEGGPNQEFALSAALALKDEGIVVASVDTDGIDGATDVAGAIVNEGTISDADGYAALEANDAMSVLEDAGALLRTGPSGTNVNDLRVIVIESTD